MDRAQVVSSNVYSVGYDAQTLTLEVQFKDRNGGPGKIYQYSPVSPEVHLEITQSESIGRTFNTLVKGDPNVTTMAVADEPTEVAS
jgi:hypothetical protein